MVTKQSSRHELFCNYFRSICAPNSSVSFFSKHTTLSTITELSRNLVVVHDWLRMLGVFSNNSGTWKLRSRHCEKFETTTRLRTIWAAGQSYTEKYREKIRNLIRKRIAKKNCDTHFSFECVWGRPKFELAELLSVEWNIQWQHDVWERRASKLLWYGFKDIRVHAPPSAREQTTARLTRQQKKEKSPTQK